MNAVLDYVLWIYQVFSLKHLAIMVGILVLAELAIGRAERAPWSTMFWNALFILSTFPILIALRPAVGALVNDIAAAWGGPWIDLTFAGGATVLGQIAAMVTFLFAFDMLYYWHHRMQHRIPAAWVTHKLHHADEDMGVTTSYKHHWTDELLRTFTIFIPMGVLFKFEPVTMFWLSAFFSFHQLFVHANVNLSFGWFDRLLASPALHRVHHSRLEEHFDKNFATYFPIIDVMFGTFHPAPKVGPPTGIPDTPPIIGVIEGHVYPFRDWWNMARGSSNAAADKVRT